MATLIERPLVTGILPIPRERRTLGLWDGFVLWADLGVSFLVMVVGMFLVPGLGLAEALLAILIGAVIGNLLLGLGAIVGSETGTPTMVLLRAPLGIRGSYAPTVLNIVQLLIGGVFVPLLGLQVADYFVVSRRQYAVDELYQPSGRYWYTGGVNVLGIAIWLVGIATYFAISGLPALSIPVLLPWVTVGASLPSFAVAFVLYAALGRMIGVRPA